MRLQTSTFTRSGRNLTHCEGNGILFYRRLIAKNPMPIAAAPITTAGSSGDSGDVVGQGVGIFIVDVLIVVAVFTGAAAVVSSVIYVETRLSLA